jgi:phosphate transport system permease protein
LTLALLTLPVVVVSVGQGLARIPPDLAAGSLALGATRGETVWRLLLPAARPALLTGLILAIARAAGAVAPLMLVGVVKLAPALPVDGDFPYLHPSRQFMHLGFSVYDAALASPDMLRGVPRAYAYALLLVGVAFALNIAAIVLRARLGERYRALGS